MKKQFIIKTSIVIALILVVVVVAVKIADKFPFRQIEYAHFYKEAKNLEKEGNYRKAYYKYAKINSSYKAYEAVLFNKANCAEKIGDEKTAVEMFSLLVKKYPKSPLAPSASYNAGQAYMRLKNYEKAKEQFKYTAKNYPNTDYELASFYYLGKISLKNNDKEGAAACFYKYLRTVRNGMFSLECAKELEALQNSGMKISNVAQVEISRAYLDNKEFDKAMSLLANIPLADSWTVKAETYLASGNKDEAYNTLASGIGNYSKGVSKEDLEKAYQSFVELNPAGRKNAWIEIEKTCPQSMKDVVLYNKATMMPPNEAVSEYEKVWVNFPDSPFASEALWNLIWQSISVKDYKKAIYLSKKHIDKYSNTNASPKVLFWLGKIYEKTGSKETAFYYYKKVLELYKDDYYAFRANGRITALKGGIDEGWDVPSFTEPLRDDVYSPKFPYTQEQIEKKYGGLVAELFNVKDYETLKYLNIKDGFIQSWIKLQAGYKTTSATLARDEMKNFFPRIPYKNSRWQLAYPIYFTDKVNFYSRINNLNPIFVLSIIKEESHFNEYSESSVGAKGLMQIMPTTAEQIVKMKGYESGSEESLYNPDYNIKLGSSYIRNTIDIMNGNEMLAICAYNSGPGAVSSWVKNLPVDNDYDEFIENIPYAETQNYVKKIYRSYWNYKNIYGLS